MPEEPYLPSDSDLLHNIIAEPFVPMFQRWLAAHDAAVRADQAEKDAQIAHDWLWDDDDKPADIAREVQQRILRAVVLTPTTKETEQ